MIRPYALLVSSLLLSACATNEVQPAAAPEQASAKTDSAQVCEWAAPTGSRFKKRVCWTDAESAQAKDEARRFKNSFERSPAVNPKGR
jgi:hypothetical protein